MTQSRKKKPYMKAVVFGIFSIASYVLLFSRLEWVTEVYTKGGIYTVLPVTTALYFSFLHGAFASNVLDILGIEAAKSKSRH
ncbi:MAG: hypothetical protein P8013_11525 [Candidatus Sulfobium sp.]